MEKVVNYSFILLTIVLIPTNLWAFDWTTDYKFDQKEINLLVAQTILQIIDWRQTLKISANPEQFRELNSIMGEHPSRSKVNLYMGASLLIKTALTYYTPDILHWAGMDYKKSRKGRKVLQVFFITSSGICVYNNIKIGLGLGINW